MNLLTVSGISKQKDRNYILHNISFTQQPFQKIVIAGETGSGKSTLLKIIAGWIQPDEGEVVFEGKRIKGPEEKLLPGHPGIAYLSQHFELRNNYFVAEELSYTNQLTDKEAGTIYEVCRINHLLQRRTDQLSGGEKQRIALARVLIASPKLLLLDEPFSNLDKIHKHIMQSVIFDIGERLNITCLLISHDPLDILSWADEIIVLKNGHLIQKGAPEHIYQHPVNEYTAGLFGSYTILTPAQVADFIKLPEGKNLMIRPEHCKIVAEENKDFTGKVKQVNFYGSYYEIKVLLAEASIIIKSDTGNFFKGETVYVSFDRDEVWFI